MKNIIVLAIVAVTFLSCNKKDYITPTGDLLYNLQISTHSGLADGSTPISVSVNINKLADPSRRNVLFAISTGNFTNGQNSILVVPADLNGDSLTARASFTSPSNPGKIIIRVMPNIADSNKYELKDSVIFSASLPSKISLQTSSYGLRYNFQSEDTIIASVKNSQGQGVSNGIKVLFEDSLVSGPAALGKYRPSNIISTGSSRASTIYSNGTQPAGVFILIRGTVLDDLGQKTNMTDYLILKTIN